MRRNKRILKNIRQLARAAKWLLVGDPLRPGGQANRFLLDHAWYFERHAVPAENPEDVLGHYRKVGWRQGFDPNPLFDTNWYVSTYRKAFINFGADPLTHFVCEGWRLGFRPNPFFVTQVYLQDWDRGRANNADPLTDYIAVGRSERKSVNQFFDSTWYEKTHLHNAKWSYCGLAHYLRIGAYSGLSPGPQSVGSNSIQASASHLQTIQRTYTRMVSAIGNVDLRYSGNGNPQRLYRRGRGRIAVYTAIIGGYDTLKLPYPHWQDRVDFFCFSNQRFPETGCWNLLMPDYYNVDPTRIARFYKTHPHVYFANYDCAIWIDGNIAFRQHPGNIVDALSLDVDLASFRHPERTNLEQEVAACVKGSKEDPSAMLAQIARYRTVNYQQSRPLIESNVVISRPQRTAKFFDSWWSEIERGTRRDQLSINYCIDNSPEVNFSFLADKSARHSENFLFVKHLT